MKMNNEYIPIERKNELNLKYFIKKNFTKQGLPETMYFTRYSPHHKIISAIDGRFFTCNDNTFATVGKHQERYFKVSLSILKDNFDKHLYYETPHDFEKHFNCTVNEDIIDKWNNRQKIVNEKYYNEEKKNQNKDENEITEEDQWTGWNETKRQIL